MNRVAAVLLCMLLLVLAAPDVHSEEIAASFPHGDEIRNEVEKYLGIPYLRGGSSRRGVDCSGLVRLVYKTVFDFDLPYIASLQYSLPVFKRISESVLQTGDLIFFSPTTRKKRINHVGIYLSFGKFAHAIRKKGVVISDLEDRHWRSRIVSFKRFMKEETKDQTGTL